MTHPLPMGRPLAWLFMSLLVLMLVACANPALREAQDLSQAGQHEAALSRLQQALRAQQDDRALRSAVLKQTDTTVAYLVYQADAARSAGRLDDIEAVLKRLEAAAPGHPRAVWLRGEVDRIKRHQRLMQEARQSLDARAYERAETALRTILSEDLGNATARGLLTRIEEMRADQTRRASTLQLATATKPITLEFREAALRTVFEALARAANVNFVFDKDVRGDAKVTLFLRNTTVDEAMRVILSTQQLGAKLLNDNTVLVFPNTQQKQRDLLDTVTRSFYLVNADPKQVQTMIRTVAKTRDIYVDERLNLVVARDTPEVMRLVERLVQSVDLPDPEVMMEVEVMEVSSKKLMEIGITPVSTASYGLPGGGATISTRDGLKWSTPNPFAVATLRGTSGNTNMLANPKIRARNREKAKIMLGEKLPVFTSNLVAGTGGGASTTITYMDVGLKLDIEPQVQLDNDVTMKIALEVSTVTGRVEGPAGSGSSAYQVGTRQATTTLRLKDGETQILAGLINDDESRSSAGIPGLHDLPIAGRLFGTTKDEHNKTEIVLLVTPHIVRNLPQPDTAGSALPSGTESQPGAARLLISEGTAGSGAGPGASGGARGAVQNRFRPGAAAPGQAEITGPEEVMPGASFQVTVRNPAETVLQTTVLFDAQWFAGPAGGEGGVAVEVPAQGSRVVTLTAKPAIAAGEATVSLASGGTLTLRVRPSGADAPPEPEPDPAPPASPPAAPESPPAFPDNDR